MTYNQWLKENPKTASESLEDWRIRAREAKRGLVEKPIQRPLEVSNIKVTISKGYVLDGDEISQDRINRAITALSPAPEGTAVQWKTADNFFVDLTKNDLIEALMLAGLEMTKIWKKWG